MSCSSILRIGPSIIENDSNASTAILRDALVEHFDGSKTNNTSSTITTTNRYFSAEILLVNQFSSTQGGEVKEDGIVLVFNDVPISSSSSSSFHQNTFDSLSMAHEQAEEEDQCGDLLRLCVGVSIGKKQQSGTTKAEEEEYSRRVLWCLDRGYEYVEADLSDEGKRRGHNDRDKDGFARVVEAIAGTVWSSAVMGKSKSSQLKGSYEKAERALCSNSSVPSKETSTYSPPTPAVEVSSESKTTTVEGRPAIDSDERADAVSEELISKGGEEEEDQEEKNHEPTISAQEALSEVQAKHNANTTQEEEKHHQMEKDEELFDDLENAMKEASRIREASKNGMMSDDTRRQLAGDAAMRIMNLMSHLDFMDDEDEHGSSSDDE
uniref:Uncharacterized protein n=1 Tax=Ditylum brightwellii TaxID=49249 RepID=A0A7S2EA86_9STRA|mmetsp:Transcript_21461/g.31901  ORF Transcript_21461/g.31901 Transcript_21461/m.31901 type:complete len:380 (+) Transcript_21461:225-1364(+)